MKLPSLPQLHKKESRQLFLSLLLYPDAVEAAVWEIHGKSGVSIIGAVTQQTLENGWDERLEAADKCITTLEDIAKSTDITKVILGLPAPYLTQDGDIVKEIRPHIKKLTHALGLEPIGFVSIYQAIIHKYKRDEGVPPSLILLGFTAGSITVSLYRVGVFAGQVTIPREGSVAAHLEDALLQFSQSSVLPSRILLYGTKLHELELAKREILKHQWTARANFIHFPKVEILPGDGAAIAVSFAGAAELTHTLGDEEPVEEESEEEVKEEPEEDVEEVVEEETEAEIHDGEEFEEETEEETDPSKEEEIREEFVEETDVAEEKEQVEDEETDEEFESEEHANVIPVDPETLGFTEESSNKEAPIRTGSIHHKKRRPFPLASLIGRLKRKFSRNRDSSEHSSEPSGEKKSPVRLLLIIIPILLLLVGGYFLLDTILPKAQVTLVTIPKTVTLSENIVVDPNVADITEGTIPGRKKEQSVSGEKTVPSTGKKTIGDAAKGTLTIINKSTVSRTFKKGTTVTTGSIDFTLEQDVSVASASETFQGITYSKGNVAVTAKQIGTKGNIAAGKDFTIAGVSSSIATGRNDEAFSGGTSKDLMVVSRADQDAIVKQLTTELTAKANENFQAEGGETLIPETIKTTVTDKTFSAEIGEEAKEVNGKVTITITGIGFSSGDVTKLLRDKVKEQVPEKYTLSSDLPNIDTGTPEVAKDGSIALSATISATALPSLDLPSLSNALSGKSINDAKQHVLSLTGISDVTFGIQSLLHKDRLPKRPQNITIVVNTGK